MFKQLIITIALLGTAFAHAASEHTGALVATSRQLSNPFEIVGLSCGFYGNSSLIAPTVSADSRECSITFVYSEHQKLKSQEVLNEIACNLAQKPVDYDDRKSFESTCNTETSKYIPQTLTGLPDDSCTCISERTPINLIALCIKLDLERMKYVGYYLDNTDYGNSGSGSLCMTKMGNGKKMRSATATLHLPLPSDTIVESAQQEAERLQKERPNESFHLILDVKKWKKIVAQERAQARAKAEEARKNQPEPTNPMYKRPECLQQ